jgi:hypothetical protein
MKGLPARCRFAGITLPRAADRVRLLPLLVLLGLAGLAGCAGSQMAERDDDLAPEMQNRQGPPSVSRKALQKRSLAVRTGRTPSFYADTPGRRAYGIAGVIAMMREGNRLVRDYGIADPVTQLSEDLATTLAARNGMRTGNEKSADLLLNVKTINWDFRPYRNDADNLYVVYSARVSLVDRRSGETLASGKCRSRRDGEGDSATLDQLLADGARRLQSELREAAAECAQGLKSGTLSALLGNPYWVARQGAAPEPPVPVR